MMSYCVQQRCPKEYSATYSSLDILAAVSSTPFAIYKFYNALVTSDVFGSSQDGMSEQVSFNFTKIESDITVGATSFHSCYDILANKPC